MRFEWDEAKRRANIHRHGFDFEDGEQVFAGETVTELDDRFNYGERRFLTLGLLRGTVVAIAYTEVEEVVRLISLRKASKNEQKIYWQEVRD
jgi:uncharacterized DUF497 family protein